MLGNYLYHTSTSNRYAPLAWAHVISDRLVLLVARGAISCSEGLYETAVMSRPGPFTSVCKRHSLSVKIYNCLGPIICESGNPTRVGPDENASPN